MIIVDHVEKYNVKGNFNISLDFELVRLLEKQYMSMYIITIVPCTSGISMYLLRSHFNTLILLRSAPRKEDNHA